MSDYESPIDFNWLGVAFVSDRVPAETAKTITDFMEALQERAQTEFSQFLDNLGLEQVMGVVLPKGIVPPPAPMPDFIRYKNYRIYPNDDETCFTVYHESHIGTGAADYIADSREAAFAHIDSNPAVIPTFEFNPTDNKHSMPVSDEFECETRDCAFNSNGLCKRKAVKGAPPRITEDDGCIDGIIDIGL